MSVAGEFATALATLDWARAEELAASHIEVNVTGDWRHGGTSMALSNLRLAATEGAVGIPPLALEGTISHLVACDERMAVEISGVSDYAMMLTVENDKIARLALYFDTLAYRYR